MPTGLWLYSYLALWGLLLFACVVMVALIRQIGTLHAYYVKNNQDMGLTLGALAPALSGVDIFDKAVSLGTTRGNKTVIYFVSTGCSSCRQSLARVHALSGIGQTEGFEIVVIFSAGKTRVHLYLAELWRGILEHDFAIVADERADYTNKYKVAEVPYTVIVDEEGYIGAKGMPITLSEVASLCRQTDRLREQRHEHGANISFQPLPARADRQATDAATT